MTTPQQKIHTLLCRNLYDTNKHFHKIVNKLASGGDEVCRKFLQTEYGVQFITSIPQSVKDEITQRYKDCPIPTFWDLETPRHVGKEEPCQSHRQYTIPRVKIKYTMKQLAEMLATKG